MLTKEDVHKIIEECREVARGGLGNGTKGTIQDLKVDFLSPPADFLGRQENPAIFVNRYTYRLLGKHHAPWVVDQTIAVKESFLENPRIRVIGILVHETGHAFNVAAKIENSEANAYIFEIEVLTLWYKTKNPALLGCSKLELLDFLNSRLLCYRIEIRSSAYLANLIKEIEQNTIFNTLEITPKLVSTPQLDAANSSTFFKHTSDQLPSTEMDEQEIEVLPMA